MGFGSSIARGIWRMPSRVFSAPTRAAEGLAHMLSGEYKSIGKFNKFGEIGKDYKATRYAKENPTEFWWYDVKKDASGNDVKKLGGYANFMYNIVNGLRGFNHAFRGKSPNPIGGPHYRGKWYNYKNIGTGIKHHIGTGIGHGLKDTVAGGITFGALNTAADAIAPASGYYLNMPYTDPKTGEQKTIKVHADHDTLNPTYIDVTDPETGKVIGKRPKIIHGHLEKANPYAVTLSNMLRLGTGPVFTWPNASLIDDVAPYFLPAKQNGIETKSNTANIASLLMPSAETAKLYADNVKSKLHELYNTKTPSQIRELMNDRAALADYLTSGVELPTRASGIMGAASRWADEYTAGKVKNTLRDSLEKNLPEDIGMYLSAANVAGDLPIVGNSVNDMVRRAIDSAVGNIDEKIYGAYADTLSPIARYTGLTGSEFNGFTNLGLLFGDARIEARRNKNNQTGQNPTTNI